MELQAKVGGVGFSLQTTGVETTILGFYEHYPLPTSESPSARIHVEIRSDFHEGRVRGPSYPGFETKRLSLQESEFTRFDAEGKVRWDQDGLDARFVCGSSPNSLEAVIRIALSIAMPHQGALIFHSSSVADKLGAHLFSGRSEAGKSTIAAMLSEAYPVTKISDELCIAYRKEGSWTLSVSPFIGSANLPHGEERPLQGIHVLEQWPTHERSRVSGAQAMGEMPKHVLTYAQDSATFQKVLDLVGDLIEKVPVYRLRFAKRPDVGDVIGLTC